MKIQEDEKRRAQLTKTLNISYLFRSAPARYICVCMVMDRLTERRNGFRKRKWQTSFDKIGREKTERYDKCSIKRSSNAHRF